MYNITWSNMLGLQGVILEYWIIPFGLILLYFYGRFHFNTPDYALSGSTGAPVPGLIRDLPMAKLRGLAPPIYTTTRARYRRYVLRYVAILWSGFLFVIVAPELVTFIIQLRTGDGGEFVIPKDIGQRGVWALFALTGFLSSFPWIKEIDGWLLKQLHKDAIIPDGAEMTAETLFDAEYRPRPEIAEEVIRNIQSEHLKRVALGLKSGSLESGWYHLRCITIATKHLLRNDRNIEIRRLFRDDFSEIEDSVLQLRERVIEFLEEQEANVPQGYEDIDSIYKSRSDDPVLKRLLVHRSRLEVEIQALRFRACRLCALIIFASETQPETMSKALKQLGFQVDIYNVPGWHWEALCKIVVAIYLAIIIPSLVYGLALRWLSPFIPPQMIDLVPNDPLAVAIWGLEGTCLHTVALLIALKIKRNYARRQLAEGITDSPETLVVALVAYILILPLQCLMAYFNGIAIWQTFFWAVLPTVTAIYSSKYIDKARMGKGISNIRSLKQALIMALCTLFVSVTILINDFNLSLVDTTVWIFLAYSAACAALIGFTFGQIFQRTYSHCGFTDELFSDPDPSRNSERRMIGDFLVGKTSADVGHAVP